MLATGAITRPELKSEVLDSETSAEVHSLLLRALNCYRNNGANAVRLVTKASRILGGCNIPQEEDFTGQDSASRGLAAWQASKIKAHISERLSTSIAVTDLAQIANLSTSYFCTLFKTTFGRSPHNYVLAQRVERAKLLMETTNAPLSQIALSCGLSDQAHLSRHFRRFTGSTPSGWRRRRIGTRFDSASSAAHESGAMILNGRDASLQSLVS
ncbi:AraC family transcriptional regulator [Rhizobium sp. Root1220]|uniref:helix-turn-helix domain-containing protein n=1 Tax=Rhizobium sp. Root1220 TaxID=1736432 RepID=UPI0006F848EA|nr:AraC family transcriptional regulator [Rhizobium sp. Root1220]KQV83556.1 hypothetical protein ASC90_19855 [Rhizobium sp. Root1220]